MSIEFSHSLDHLGKGPFARLSNLFNGIKNSTDHNQIDLSLGEPHQVFPDAVGRIIAEQEKEWGFYPPLRGSMDLRDSIAEWFVRRYALPNGMINAERNVLALSGTREGLYLVAQTVVHGLVNKTKVLIPNPFYAAYAGAAAGTGAEPVFVSGAKGTNDLPDYASLSPSILKSTALCYLCSPSNPQGVMANFDYLKNLISLAREYGFLLAVDECYGEIYNFDPPPGAIEVCASMDGGSLDNVVVFHSLSKRSSVPGLRSGFVAGDPKVISAFANVRAYSAATAPGPILAASAALWRDDTHVREVRENYKKRFDQSDRILGNRYNYYRPDGAFFLWLRVGDGEEVAKKLWERVSLKVMPGSYLSYGSGEQNPGMDYIRIALVENEISTESALNRILDNV